MVDEGKMSISERRKYLDRVHERYLKADRTKKEEMLDEMELVTGLHRKSLIRLLKPDGLIRKKRTRRRGKVYGVEVEDALKIISESLDYICAERLTPSLVRTARHLARHKELTLSPELETLLARISVSSVQRILSRLTRDTPKLPRKGPTEANQLRKEVPM
ncbi:MAG: integrase, partial [Chloroflexi bacterium]|nr:integrase [Chloroflexota bacterium]